MTDAAADRFVADLEAAVRNGILQRKLADHRARHNQGAALTRARLGLPERAA